MSAEATRGHSDQQPAGNLPDLGISMEEISEAARALLTEQTQPPAAETATETYQQRARREFVELREAWFRLPDAERDPKFDAIFDQLFVYFRDAEISPEGDENFTLKNAHNAMVGDFARPEFHASLMGRLMTHSASTNPAEQKIGMLATEFDANRKRRLGFRAIKAAADQQGISAEGEALVTEATETFRDVLRHWRSTGDLKSQSRTLYELAFIHTERQEWREAAAAQAESAIVAERGGDIPGAIVARVTAAEALLKGSLGVPANIAATLHNCTIDLIRLATGPSGSVIAKRWVSNAYVHQAEACLQAARATRDVTEISRWKAEGNRCLHAVRNDEGGFMSELAEARNIGQRVDILQAEFDQL